jgi:hypothetical protein
VLNEVIFRSLAEMIVRGVRNMSPVFPRDWMTKQFRQSLKAALCHISSTGVNKIEYLSVLYWHHSYFRAKIPLFSGKVVPATNKNKLVAKEIANWKVDAAATDLNTPTARNCNSIPSSVLQS